MPQDPFDALRSNFDKKGVGFDELGTEEDPDAEYLVAEVDEGAFDTAANVAEEEGFNEITTESGMFGGDLLARFGRKK